MYIFRKDRTMIFEADNVTEQLIGELQKSIEDTIVVLKQGQHNMEDMLKQVQSEIEEVTKEEQVKLLEGEVKKIGKKVGDLFTYDQGEDVLSNVEKIASRVEYLSEMMKSYEGLVKELEGNLLQGVEKIDQKANLIASVEVKNAKSLLAITEYLKLPGYKRFFKGMEVKEEHEES